MSKAYHELLTERVIQQIIKDVESGDTTAIHEMFTNIHETVMEAFLPEAVLAEFVNGESNEGLT